MADATFVETCTKFVVYITHRGCGNLARKVSIYFRMIQGPITQKGPLSLVFCNGAIYFFCISYILNICLVSKFFVLFTYCQFSILCTGLINVTIHIFQIIWYREKIVLVIKENICKLETEGQEFAKMQILKIRENFQTLRVIR